MNIKDYTLVRYFSGNTSILNVKETMNYDDWNNPVEFNEVKTFKNNLIEMSSAVTGLDAAYFSDESGVFQVKNKEGVNIFIGKSGSVMVIGFQCYQLSGDIYDFEQNKRSGQNTDIICVGDALYKKYDF